MVLGVELALAMVVIGILMLLAEAVSPGAFILVPATVLILLGGIGLVAPEWLMSWWSPLIAAVVTIPITYVTMKMYQKLAPPVPPETTVASSLIGMTGVVTTAVSSDNLRGKVRIAHDSWSATAQKEIAVGAKVVVRSSEGVHVVVEEIGAGKEASQ